MFSVHSLKSIYLDGCNYSKDSIDIDSETAIDIDWPETNLGITVSVPCPCAEFAGSLAGRAFRHCGGTYSQGARWEDFDVGNCNILKSETTLHLCKAAKVLRDCS